MAPVEVQGEAIQVDPVALGHLAGIGGRAFDGPRTQNVRVPLGERGERRVVRGLPQADHETTLDEADRVVVRVETRDLRHGDVHAVADRLHGAEITLDFPSVGATENLVTAAVFAKGTTIIDNAAREPEIVDLCNMLVAMGARIEGVGSSTITIHGVERDELRPVNHAVITDRVQAATYVAAAAITGGEVTVRNAVPEHMEMLLRRFGDMGITVEPQHNGVLVVGPDKLRSIDVVTLPFPGVATDYKPLVVALLSVADSVGIVTENLYPGRFRYVDELRRLGANIRTDGHHAIVRGVPRLSGAPVRAPDIRAGAALVVAGLVADGETVISDVHHIDRGYDDLVGRLASLGADIARV